MTDQRSAAHALSEVRRDVEATIWTVKCFCGWGNSTLDEQDAVDRLNRHVKEAGQMNPEIVASAWSGRSLIELLAAFEDIVPRRTTQTTVVYDRAELDAWRARCGEAVRDENS